MPTKTLIGISANRLIPDRSSDKELRNLLLRSIMNNTNLADELFGVALHGLTRKVKKYYEFGKDNTARGLPNITFLSGKVDKDALTDIIYGIEGITVDQFGIPSDTITYHTAYTTFADANFFAEYYSFITYGMNPITKEFPAFQPPGTPFGQTTTLDSGQFINTFGLNTISNTDLQLNLSYSPSGGTNTLTVPNYTAHDPSKQYYHVLYSVDSNPTNYKYFIYEVGLGTYPTLDNQLAIASDTAFPILSLREDDVFTDQLPIGNQLRTESEELIENLDLNLTEITNLLREIPNDSFIEVNDFKIKLSGGIVFNENNITLVSVPIFKDINDNFVLNVNLQVINDKLKDSNGDPLYYEDDEVYVDGDSFLKQPPVQENPDVDDIEDAFIHLGVDIQTDSQAGLEYLYNFWEYCFIDSLSSLDDTQFDNEVNNGSINRTLFPNGMNISEGSEFNTTLGWNYIVPLLLPTATVPDSEVGKFGSITDIQPQENTFVGNSGGYAPSVNERSTFYVYEQISPNLRFGYLIGGIVSNTYGIHKDKVFSINLEDSLEVDTENNEVSGLFVPLLYNLATDDFNIFEESELFAESLQLFVHVEQKIKLKWYETGLFKAVLAVVSFVLIIVSVVTGTAYLIPKIVALGFSTLTATILAVLVVIGIQIGISELVNLAAKEFGEVGAILAAIAAVIITGKISPPGTAMAPWAETLLRGVSVINIASSAYISTEQEKLLQETEEFLETKEEKNKELERFNTILEPFDTDLLDIILRVPEIDITETPTQFFQRTIHTPNIGVLSLDIASSFDRALALPEVDQPIDLYI